MKSYLYLAILALSFTASESSRKNVLFLVSDDMRPELGAYAGHEFPTPIHPKMHTPNLDSLASRSLLLRRAYVQQSVCSPSRTSLLTGRRPDTTLVHDLIQYWRDVAGNFTTIPQYFKDHGYRTAGMGKIFHPGRASGNNDPLSWTDKYFSPHAPHWDKDRYQTWTAVDDKEEERYPLIDTQTAAYAVKTLKEVAPKALSGEQPFFVGVGFHKPHLPFLFPARFLQYYPEEDIKLPNNPHAPYQMPQVAWSDFDELRHYHDIELKYGYGDINSSLPDFKVKEMRRAYYAAISYTDYLVGLVVKTLDSLGLANNTVISFWGDHGWQLGEHGEWCKHTNFEIATHAPMMVSVPSLTQSGLITDQLTEFVDLFPTLAEAAGLPQVPLCPEDSTKVTTCTEGLSFVPLMKNTQRAWKSGAFSQYPRMLVDGNVVMGYRLRTDLYSYTEWRYYDTVKYTPIWTKNGTGEELYDHKLDPEENVNSASDERYSAVKKQLHDQLVRGWRKAFPPQNFPELPKVYQMNENEL